MSRFSDDRLPGAVPTTLGPRPPTANQEDIELRRYVQLFRRQKWLFALILIGAVAVGQTATALQTTLYESRALLQVTPDAVNPTPYADPFDSMNGKGNYETYVRTQSEVLVSPTIRGRVAKEAELQHDPVLATEISRLGERFSVQRIEGSQLLSLSYEAEDPEAAAFVVNLFAEQLIAEHMQRKREARTRVIQSLKEELAALQERLQTSERELADYAANHEIVHLEGPGDGANPALARFLAVDQNLVEADAARIAARSSLRRLESGNVDTSRQLATPTIQALSAKLSTLESELGTLLTTYGERWPAVIAKRDEIAYVRRQLDEEDQAARTSAIADAQLDFDIAESRFNMLNEAVARERNSVSKHQRAAIEYQLLRREVETTEGLHANLLESIKRSTVMAEFDAPNLQIVERGSPNTTPRSPSRTLNLALSLLMGLGLGFGIVVARDYWDRSIANLFDLESVLGLPPIGTLPLVEGDDFEWLCGPRQLLPSTRMLESRSSGQIEPVSANSDLGDSILWSDEPVLREAVLSICTSILLAQTDRELNVIAVTSAMPGEGKTTVSKLLAQALALSGKKTLLIDADLRRGSLSDSYDGGRTEGLSLLLSGNSTHLPLRSPAIPNLHVLTAGPRPPNPVALLSSQTMAKLISSSRPDFRYIVIDTPPIIGLADARIVSALADGVLLAVRAGQTGRDAVAHAWTLIEASGGRGLGVVLNGTKQEDQKFLYAYSYYN